MVAKQVSISMTKRKISNIALKSIAYNLLTLVIFLSLWSITKRLIHVSYFPSPEGVLKAFLDLVVHGDLEGYTLGHHIWASSLRVFSGFGAAFVTGTIIGILMGLYPYSYHIAKVIIEPIRFIPPIAWVPMVIILFSGYSRYVFLIWLGAFFPIYISVFSSIPTVEPLLKNAVKVYGGSWFDILRKVIIPSITPEILSGARIGLGTAWACIVAAEMIGGETVGLGRLILKYSDLMMTNEIVVGMVLVGVIGLLCNEAVLQVEGKLLKWRSQIDI